MTKITLKGSKNFSNLEIADFLQKHEYTLSVKGDEIIIEIPPSQKKAGQESKKHATDEKASSSGTRSGEAIDKERNTPIEPEESLEDRLKGLGRKYDIPVTKKPYRTNPDDFKRPDLPPQASINRTKKQANLRLTEQFLEKVDAAAKREGKTRTEWITQLIAEKLNLPHPD